jgi:hypothetical protein
MDNQKEAQRLSLEDSLKRGLAFEALIRSEGWEYIKAWYQNKIQHFATSLLTSDSKGIAEFENERRELIGLRRLMGLIDNDLKVLHDNEEKEKNEKHTTTTKE